jgi:hypothetical protein
MTGQGAKALESHKIRDEGRPPGYGVPWQAPNHGKDETRG